MRPFLSTSHYAIPITKALTPVIFHDTDYREQVGKQDLWTLFSSCLPIFHVILMSYLWYALCLDSFSENQ